MKHNKYILALAFASMLTLGSCGDDFLGKEPQGVLRQKPESGLSRESPHDRFVAQAGIRPAMIRVFRKDVAF